MPTFQEVFDACAFRAFEKQRRLSLLVGEHEWQLDSEQAMITFDGKLRFPVGFLGTESEISRSWLWADANERVTFPTNSLDCCQTVRAGGKALGVSYFQLDWFDFTDEIGTPDGHTLAMVSTCLGNGSCYYRCPHDNGAVFVVINDPAVDAQPGLDSQGFHEAFTDLMWVPGDMKRRVLTYFSDKGYVDKSWNGDELTCTLYTGEKIGLKFEKSGGGRTSVSFTHPAR
jgi:hypothetical protein